MNLLLQTGLLSILLMLSSTSFSSTRPDENIGSLLSPQYLHLTGLQTTAIPEKTKLKQKKPLPLIVSEDSESLHPSGAYYVAALFYKAGILPSREKAMEFESLILNNVRVGRSAQRLAQKISTSKVFYLETAQVVTEFYFDMEGVSVVPTAIAQNPDKQAPPTFDPEVKTTAILIKMLDVAPFLPFLEKSNSIKNILQVMQIYSKHRKKGFEPVKAMLTAITKVWRTVHSLEAMLNQLLPIKQSNRKKEYSGLEINKNQQSSITRANNSIDIEPICYYLVDEESKSPDDESDNLVANFKNYDDLASKLHDDLTPKIICIVYPDNLASTRPWDEEKDEEEPNPRPLLLRALAEKHTN